MGGTLEKMSGWNSAVTRTNWADDAEDDKSEVPAMGLMEEATETATPAPASAADGGSFDDVQITRADLPANTETEVNAETGCKTVTEYKLDQKGRRVKVVKVVKVDSWLTEMIPTHFVSVICRRKQGKETCRNSFDHSGLSTVSIWPRTVRPRHPVDLLSLHSCGERMLNVLWIGWQGTVTIILSCRSNGPSLLLQDRFMVVWGCWASNFSNLFVLRNAYFSVDNITHVK